MALLLSRAGSARAIPHICFGDDLEAEARGRETAALRLSLVSVLVLQIGSLHHGLGCVSRLNIHKSLRIGGLFHPLFLPTCTAHRGCSETTVPGLRPPPGRHVRHREMSCHWGRTLHINSAAVFTHSATGRTFSAAHRAAMQMYLPVR